MARSLGKILKDKIKFVKIPKSNFEYVYYDDDSNNNGFLIEAFTHNGYESMRRFRIRFIDQFREFLEINSSPSSEDKITYQEWYLKYLAGKEYIETNKYTFLLIYVNTDSLTKDKKILYDKNMASFFSILNNSSIWVRVVANDVDKKKAIEEFQAIAEMKLYDYDSAKENFDFNCRIQLENWLEGAHGHDVTPILYGNESEFYKKLFE